MKKGVGYTLRRRDAVKHMKYLIQVVTRIGITEIEEYERHVNEMCKECVKTEFCGIPLSLPTRRRKMHDG